MKIVEKNSIRHTLHALKEHLQLQGITAWFDLRDRGEAVDVQMTLHVGEHREATVSVWVHTVDRNTTITALKARIETIRDQVLPAFLGPARG